MAFKIEERFEIRAPLERVWAYLIDPAKVVVCLPGAELLELKDDQTFLGAIKVKVGPLSMSYKGSGRFTEINEQLHQARMVGEAREIGGSGSAKVNMMSTLTPLATGMVEVVVSAEVNLVGKIVQFGRGMIEEVSKQLFRQFSACVKQQLEMDTPAQGEQPGAATETSPPTATPESNQQTVAGKIESVAQANQENAASETKPQSAVNRSVPKGAAAGVQPVRALPLLLHALRAMITRFFKRLFGVKSEI